MTEAVNFCFLLGLEHGPHFKLHFHQFFVFLGFLHCLILAVLELAM